MSDYPANPDYPARLDALAATIADEHQAAQDEDRRAQEHGRASLEHARRAGEALAAAKSQVVHGEWLPWLRERVPDLSARMATNYMVIARRWPEIEDANQKRVSDLSLRGALAYLATPTKPTAPLALAPGGHDGDPDLAPDDAPLPTGRLRLVRLMFDEVAAAEFDEQVRDLADVYRTVTTTATIAKVISVAHAAIAGGSGWCKRSA
jgi:hypothetical protein